MVAAKHMLMILKNISCLPQSEETFINQHGLELAVMVCEAVKVHPIRNVFDALRCFVAHLNRATNGPAARTPRLG